MTEEEALNLEAELLAFCRKHNLFKDVHHKGRPNLKLITLEIMIKVGN